MRERNSDRRGRKRGGEYRSAGGQETKGFGRERLWRTGGKREEAEDGK